MNKITNSIFKWVFKIPRGETRNIATEKGLKIPMFDGVILTADHYYPRDLGARPTILIRLPYDINAYGFMGEIFAEHGFHVLLQSCRGTSSSGGEWDPFRNEQADGLDTVAWIRKQEWFNGQLGTTGESYLGFTQWAIAGQVPELKAMSTQVTSSEIGNLIYPGDSFYLGVWSSWAANMHEPKKTVQFRDVMSSLKTVKKFEAARTHLPLAELPEIASGKPFKIWRDWLEHEDKNDPWWKPSDFSDNVAKVTVPNHFVGGWYDFFQPQLLRDYQTLVQARQNPFLTIGPWAHADLGYRSTGVREAISWLRAHLLNDPSGLRDKPVRIFVMGAEEWRDYTSWPPSEMKPKRLYLQPKGELSANIPPQSECDRYRYDPANPTPSIGGAGFTLNKCRMDNRTLEARSDVLTYTSEILKRDVELIGPVSAELFVRSSLENADFFVRVCDVYPSGKSFNICDGLLRVSPVKPVIEQDGCLKITVQLWPTAYCFRRGHRIRIQVSSGSFPQWNRNLGSGEPLANAKTMHIAEQSIYHDPDHPSSIILPFMN